MLVGARLILPQGTKAPDAELLDGIDSSQYSQLSFKVVKVNGIEIIADQVTDTLEFTSGANISLTPNTNEDKITISIVEDITHRFVTDVEKATWNSKQEALGYTPINKSGDIMNGELQVPILNLGGRFKIQYDSNTDSIIIGVDN